MEKESKVIEVYPIGTLFWKMHNNHPEEFIINYIDIRIDGQNKIEYNYVIYQHAGGGKLGRHDGYSKMEDPIYFSREKLIISLFS